MSFVVDADEWTFHNSTPAIVVGYIESFISLLETLYSRKQRVWIGEDLQTRAIYNGYDIWNLRNAPEFSDVDFDMWIELASAMSRLNCYLDEPDWPIGFLDSQLTIDGAIFPHRPDASWVHHSVRSGKPMGCLGVTTSGIKATSSTIGVADIFWVTTKTQLTEFWRYQIKLNGATFDNFLRFACDAYPDIHFHNEVLAGTENLGGGYNANAELVAKYLEGINDHGAWIFTTPPPALTPKETTIISGGQPSNQLIEKRFGGIGLTISPENPDVYKDHKCRTAREITLGKEVLYCEWHGKLEGHRNRIHIHRPTASSDNKIVVAYICHHLPLP